MDIVLGSRNSLRGNRIGAASRRLLPVLIAGLVLLATVVGSVPAHAAVDTSDYLMIQIGVGGGLARINPDGTGLQPLIVDPGGDTYAGAWSLDGKYFAYRRWNKGTQRWTTGVYDAADAVDMGVVANQTLFTWAPGDTLLYGESLTALTAMTFPDRATAPFSVQAPPYSRNFAYSPDGLLLAYDSNDGNGNIFLAVREVATDTLVATFPQGGGLPSWGGDHRLAFDAYDPARNRGSVQVAQIGAAGLLDVRDSIDVDMSSATLSPDGSRMALVEAGPGSYIRHLPDCGQIAIPGYYLQPLWRPSGDTAPTTAVGAVSVLALSPSENPVTQALRRCMLGFETVSTSGTTFTTSCGTFAMPATRQDAEDLLTGLAYGGADGTPAPPVPSQCIPNAITVLGP